MKAKPSCVAGVELAGPDSAHFIPSVEALYGRAVDDVLRGALPYSVIVRNESAAAIALFGVRFDMTGANGKKYSVIHYADSLRHPEKADLVPGAARFVCAEPLYSDLVLRQSRDIDERSRMNLENLRKALQVRASLDCVAFDNGHFAGPDTNGAFDRLARERHAESELVRKISRRSPDDVEAALLHAMEIPDCKGLARRLYKALLELGPEAAQALAKTHRYRIPLRR